MTEQKALWGWYPAGNIWVKLQVAASGKLVIDPTAIFENPPTEDEDEKGPSSEWAFDHNADPDAHHVKYTDAEAKAAAVQAGAITDGVTLAPTHDAVYDALAAISAGPTIVRKTIDEIVNNSAVLQNDDHLVLPVAANEVWEFDIVIWGVTHTGQAGFKYVFTIPAGGILRGDLLYAATTALADVDGTVSRNATFVATGTESVIRNKYRYVGGASAGNIQFQWAQQLAYAYDTKVLANSYILAHRLA